MSILTEERLRRLVNTNFRMQTHSLGRMARLRLVKVRGWKVPEFEPESVPVDSFSILLRGPRGLEMPQGTYRLTHARLGSFSLFPVPMRKGRGNTPYWEVVFNRVVG